MSVVGIDKICFVFIITYSRRHICYTLKEMRGFIFKLFKVREVLF